MFSHVSNLKALSKMFPISHIYIEPQKHNIDLFFPLLLVLHSFAIILRVGALDTGQLGANSDLFIQ